LQEVDRKINIY